VNDFRLTKINGNVNIILELCNENVSPCHWHDKGRGIDNAKERGALDRPSKRMQQG
jgi:hypothetical protein